MNNSAEYIDEFLNEMKQTMSKHDFIKGSNWKFEKYDNLVNNLFSEIHEFEIKDDPQQELIDIANSCFILWARNKYFPK